MATRVPIFLSETPKLRGLCVSDQIRKGAERMNMYSLALFLHICGAIAVFAGLGVWGFGVAALRRAQRVEQARLLAALIKSSGNLVVGGIVLLGIAGFYMAVTVWGARATWIIVATISFALLAPGGLLALDPRVRAIARLAQAAQDGPLPTALAERTRDPLLATGLSVYIACLVGIVFLMTNKPASMESALTIVVAVTVGALVSLPAWRRQTHEHKAHSVHE